MSSCPFSKNPSFLFAFFALVSLGALMVAYIGEYNFGFKPCILCLYERFPYMASFVIALGGYYAYPTGRKLTSFLLALTFLIGAGISFYHIGVERHFFELSAACGNLTGLDAKTVEDLQKALTEAPVVRCDEVPFRVLGLSLTECNFLFSLLLALWAGSSLFCKKKEA